MEPTGRYAFCYSMVGTTIVFPTCFDNLLAHIQYSMLYLELQAYYSVQRLADTTKSR